jgi:hypothetical protein
MFHKDLYQYECPKIMTHKEYIELVEESGSKMFNPFLEWPDIDFPFNGHTIEDYAQQLVDEYVDAGIPSSRVLFFANADEFARYWVTSSDYPKHVGNGYYTENIEGDKQITKDWLDKAKSDGVEFIMSPIFMLLNATDESPYKVKISDYAKYLKEIGLKRCKSDVGGITMGSNHKFFCKLYEFDEADLLNLCSFCTMRWKLDKKVQLIMWHLQSK